MISTVVPSFTDLTKIGQLYVPNTAQAVAEGMKAGWSPSSLDGKRGPNQKRIALVLIDEQIDFVHTDGNLSVAGSLADVRRVVELIYREGHRITTIVPTIDTHSPYMIFFSTWWRDKAGNAPGPYTIISEDDIKNGRWHAIIMPPWSHQYVSTLAQGGKYSLMIWPFHCMDGTSGINLVPALHEAIMFHSAARYSQPSVVHKGHIPQTEFYSPLEPEVGVQNVPGGTINTAILSTLSTHDEIWVAGEAKSHCVLSGMQSLVKYFGEITKQLEVLSRVKFLMDCTSPVLHPDVDFNGIANTALERMSRQYGIALINSTDLYT